MAKIDCALEYETSFASGCCAISTDNQPNGPEDQETSNRHPNGSTHDGAPDRRSAPGGEAEAASFMDPVRPPLTLREAILNHVQYTLVRPTTGLKPVDYLKPLSLAIRDRIVDRMMSTESKFRHKDAKRLYYLSMEFLMGRSLGDNVSNLRIEEQCRGVLAGLGVDLDEVLESESDAGLGNGGLGRLAACFLESLATLGMPGYGYGIDYEYGLFKQEIVDGFQREKPDRWKANGTPFEIEHPEEAVSIPMYGRMDSQRDAGGNLNTPPPCRYCARRLPPAARRSWDRSQYTRRRPRNAGSRVDGRDCAGSPPYPVKSGPPAGCCRAATDDGSAAH